MEASVQLSREDIDAAHREMEERDRQRLAERDQDDPGTSSYELFEGDEYQDEDLRLFDEFVGGKAPTAHKVLFVGGAVHLDPPEGGWKKGGVYRVELTVRAGGVAFDDTIDGKTDQVVDCTKKTKLRVQGGQYLGEA